MKLNSFILGIMFSLLCVGIICAFLYYWYTYRMQGPTYNVKINGHSFMLEIADTAAKREKGLMNRKSLKDKGGMLFIFDKMGWYPFWMKNTYIPLDIIWIDDKKDVVFIKENAKPCVEENVGLRGLVNKVPVANDVVSALTCDNIVPLKFAKYVIELNAGKTKEINLKVGDKVDFSF